MTRKPPAESAVTLRDGDIGSERVVNRRLLLGVLGAGVAAGAILGTTAKALAADDSDPDTDEKPEKPDDDSDSDADEKPEKPAPKPDKMEETDTD